MRTDRGNFPQSAVRRVWIQIPACIIIVGLWLLPVSCGGPKPPVSNQQPPVTVIIESTYGGGLDPTRNNIISYNPLFSNIFDGLYRYDQNLQVRASLLERSRKEGDKVYFTLRKDVFFSDGSPVTSRDVLWTLLHTFRSENYTMEPFIRGASEYIQGKDEKLDGFHMESPRRFSIELVSDNDNYRYLLASMIFYILPENFDPGHPVFSGRYMIDSLDRRSDSTVLHLRPNVHRKGAEELLPVDLCFSATRDFFISRVAEESHDMVLAFGNQRTGLRESSYTLHRVPMTGKFFVMLNPVHGFFSDLENRRAFGALLRRMNLSRREEFAGTSPVRNILPYGLPGHSLFRSMKRETGTPGFQMDTSVRLQVINSSYGVRRPLFRYLEEELKKENIQMNINWMSFDEWNQMFKSGQYELTSFYYLVNLPLTLEFYRNIYLPRGELWPRGYENHRARALFRKLETEGDLIRRTRILWELEKLTREESFLLPLFNIPIICGYKQERVKGFGINSLFDIDFSRIKGVQ